jgi:hypothetical protein
MAKVCISTPFESISCGLCRFEQVFDPPNEKGCGQIVQLAHLPAYQAAGIQIFGAFDILESNRKKIEDLGVKSFSSLEEMVKAAQNSLQLLQSIN